MTKRSQNIENLFKNGLENHTVSPSSSLWKNISKKLLINKFFTFNLSSFNIYYFAILLILVSAILFYPKNKKIISENNRNNILVTENKKLKNLSDNEFVSKNEIVEEAEKEKTNKQLKIIEKTEKKHTQTIDLITNTHVNESYTNLGQNSEVEQNVKLAFKPYAKFSASISAACVPVAVLFTNASENCNSYLWDFGNGTTSSEENPIFVFKTAGEYNVTLTVKSGSNFSSISKKITVYPKPKAEFVISEKDNAFENDEIKFANLSSGFTYCNWNFGDENTSTSRNPYNKYSTPGFYDISLICFNENNCSDTSVFKNLEIKGEKHKINAPTGFVPDLSGANSGYAEKGMYSNAVFSPLFSCEVSEYKLIIFNRYGSVVFESNQIEYGWNGYNKGKISPEGVYIWKCSGKFSDGEVFVKTGNLTLLYKDTQ